MPKHTGLLLSLPAIFAFPPSVPLPTLFVFNPNASEWVVLCDGVERPTSPLVRAHRPIGVLGDYLSTASGELIVTDSGEPVTLGALRVYEVPEFVLTADGDVIAVAGR